VLTVNDRVRLRRRRWHSPAEGTTTPIDAWLDAAEATVSVGTCELACRLNGQSSNFDKTAENLARAAGVQASGEMLRQVIEAEGKAVLAAQRSGTLPVGWSAADCQVPAEIAPGAPPPAETTRVYLGSDGVLVPMVTRAEKQARRQKIREKRRQRGPQAQPLAAAKAGADQSYKEFKIVTYYDEPHEHCLVSATKGDHAAAGRLMRRDACRIRLDEADQKVANVDGAPWIRNQMKAQGLPLDAMGLDFYHLAQHVHQARRLVFGEADATGQEWVGEVLHAFKHEGYDAVWERLVPWRAVLRSRTKRQAADGLLHYVAERREMIRYPEFLAKGWQIGSGPTEAMCKTTTARLKRSGMRWDADNAEALMALAGLEQSGQWKLYWQTRLKPTG